MRCARVGVSEGLGACRRCVPLFSLALVLWGCRIYRDEDGAGALSGTAGAVAGPSAEAGQDSQESIEQKPPALSAAEEQPPPAEALSLWVLNRPETELVAKGPAPSAAPAAEGVPHPPSVALVVLGLGPSHACAERYARRALQYATVAADPLRGVAELLDELRRWRWPAATGLDAALKSSDGRFGGVQAAPASAFSVTLLEEASRRGAVLDGRSSRWSEGVHVSAPLEGPLSAEAMDSGCDSPPGEALRGPAGVLLRTANEKYFGGLVQLEGPADAGVVSGVTQYGVTLATGPAGGVMLLTDCSALPPAVLAADVYARLPREEPLMPMADASCQVNHALITRHGPRVTGTGPLAWASATDREWVTAGASPPDAGVPAASSVGGQ